VLIRLKKPEALQRVYWNLRVAGRAYAKWKRRLPLVLPKNIIITVSNWGTNDLGVDREMSWVKNKEKFNRTFWVAFILYVSGLILWAFSIIMLKFYESMLTNPDLPLEQLWRIEGALQWWNNYYLDTAFPIVTTLILIGLVLLLTLKLATPSKLDNYLKTDIGRWYWIIIVVIIATTILVFTIPDTQYPLVYLRHIFGVIFVLFLPGYSFIRALFPKTKTTKSLGQMEEIALSLAASLVLVPIVVFILSYLSLGINLTSITLGLVVITILLANIAVIRESR
jgi:hypothetical protein